MQYDFSTKTTDLDIYGYAQSLNVPTTFFDIEQSEGVVEWYVEPEAREWGFKTIDIFIKRIKISFKWTVQSDSLNNEQILKLLSIGGKSILKKDEFMDNVIEGYFEKTYENYGEFEIKNELEFKEYGYLSPDLVEIDFIRKKIEIS